MSRLKADRYASLIAEVKKNYPSITDNDINQLKLFWCEECQEINLWTYWQGRNNLDAPIMLVGQDWGSPWDKSSERTMAQISLANQGMEYNYLHDNPSITDKYLTELFSEIGYRDISSPCKDLFFTNYVLGYRNRGTSRGFRREWAEHDKAYFQELANIVEPRVILCLGRATFEGVIRSLKPSNNVRIGRFNNFIESENNPVSVELDSGKTVYVFALAHCGALGTMNRNRGKGQMTDKLQVQREDWQRILPYLE